MTIKPIPCRKCGAIPTIRPIEGLFYARCHGSFKNKAGKIERCNHWNPYEHIGLNEASCIRNWNNANNPEYKGEKYE